MTEIYHPYPAILSISHIDTVPTMVFVQRTGVVVIRFQREIFNATLADESWLFVDDGLCTTIAAVYVAGNRSIKRHHMALNRQNLPIPTEVNIPRMPSPISHALASTKRGATEVINPFLSGRAPDHNTLNTER